MSAGELAGLIAALGFVVLVGLLVPPLMALTSALRETRRLVQRLAPQEQPSVRASASPVTPAPPQAHNRPEPVAASAPRPEPVPLSGLVAGLVAGPAVKVSAFSYGVRQAVNHRRAASPAAQRRETLARVRARREQRADHQRRGQGAA